VRVLDDVAQSLRSRRVAQHERARFRGARQPSQSAKVSRVSNRPEPERDRVTARQTTLCTQCIASCLLTPQGQRLGAAVPARRCRSSPSMGAAHSTQRG
jgi:hypothetical protein